MKRGKSTPEKRIGKSLTLPYRTNSVLEAIRAQAVGKPIDVMSGYYAQEGMDVSGDFFMLDKLEKHHKIAEFKANKQILEQQLKDQQIQLKLHYEQQEAEAGKDPAGTIPQPGGNNQPGDGTIKPG